MSENFEMRREALDAGHEAPDAQMTHAGIYPIPSNGGDGGHIESDNHSYPAAVAKLPRKRGGAVQKCAVLHDERDSTATTPASAGPDRAIHEPNPKADAPGQDTSPRKGGRARGHRRSETHLLPAASAQQFEDQTNIATQRLGVLDGDPGHEPPAHQCSHAGVATTIAEIRGLWRRRQKWLKAETSLTLQCFAICWSSLGGGTENKKAAGALLARIEKGKAEPEDIEAEVSCMPILASRDSLRPHRDALEKTLGKMVRGLPAYDWIKSVYGVGDIGYAKIIGEAGAPGGYKSVSALWKRMGLAVIDGGRQRRVAGDAALDHGYSPARRAVMWNVGQGLVGMMGNGPRPGVGEHVSLRDDLSPYQKLFIQRLRYEADRDPAHRREHAVNSKTGELRESFSTHAANRARRYVEKRFLRDLYGEWRRAIAPLAPNEVMPASDPIPAQAGAESRVRPVAHR